MGAWARACVRARVAEVGMGAVVGVGLGVGLWMCWCGRLGARRVGVYSGVCGCRLYRM